MQKKSVHYIIFFSYLLRLLLKRWISFFGLEFDRNGKK